MAMLAIPLLGAAIGGSVGYAAAGYLIGTVIARQLFPPPPIVTEGPRLGDASVSASTYGLAIALGYGTIRLGGNMIWSSGIRETENSVSGGGKGGGASHVQKTYSYFSSFALAFAGIEADRVLRIWADGNIIYDASGTATVRKAGLRFRFYPGSETQLPDSLMEADKGEGQVPAHRGLCYIVFDDLPLTDFGNRIPNITAEIAFKAEAANYLRFSTEIASKTVNIDNLAVDRKRRRLYLLDENDVSPSIIHAYNYDTLDNTRESAVEPVTVDRQFEGRIYAGPYSGYIYGREGGASFGQLVLLDPDTLQIKTKTTGPAVGRIYQVVETATITAQGGKLPWAIVKHVDILENVLALVDPMAGVCHVQNINSDGTIPLNIIGMCEGTAAVTPIVWVLQTVGANNPMGLYKITVDPTLDASTGTLVRHPTIELAATFTASTWDNDAYPLSDGLGPVRDPEDGGLIFAKGGDVAGGSYVWKWREETGIVWSTHVGAREPVYTSTFTNVSQVDDGLLGWADSTGRACLLDTRTGEVIVDGFDGKTLDAGYSPAGQGLFDGPTQSVINVRATGGPLSGFVQQLFLNRYSGLGTELYRIVEDLSERVGLDPLADLDTSELTDTVRGYTVARQMTAREALDPLSSAFFFDGVESDFIIKFPKRGGDPVKTLSQSDLVLIDENGELLPETRTQEVELPERMSVQFMDVDMDYQQGTQSAKRVLAPFPTMRSQAEQTVQFAVVFTASEAKQIAERVLFSRWNERTGYSWEASPEFLALDPTDIVTINMDSGTAIQVRLSQLTVRSDLSISFEGIRETKTTFESNAVSDGALGFQPLAQPVPADTRLMMMNVPLLRDVDATGGAASRLYYAMSGYIDTWDGGVLYQSLDSGVSYDPVDRALVGATYGTLGTALPTTTLPFQTDTTTVLRVYMQVGELTAVTNAQFMNDANVAVVGDETLQNWEVIAFRDVAEVTTGVYDVSTIMRARRGTDPFVDTHIAGERFIVLARDAVNAFLLELSRLDTELPYKGVGFEQILEDADVVAFTALGRDLMPYAPTHLDAAVDGGNNIDLSWVRRTRIGGELRDGTGTVPVSEVSEAYEIDIKDGPGGTVLRTLTSTTNSKQYDNADIITDFGAVPSALSFEVFQMSDAVGRGFGTEATITL